MLHIYFADEPHCCCGTQFTGKDERPGSQRTGKIYHIYDGHTNNSSIQNLLKSVT